MGTRIETTDLARDALYTKVNQIGDEKVDLESAQTITGRKTFNDVQVLNGATLKCFNFARGTNPQTTQYVNFYTTDSTATIGDNTAFGLFRTRVEANGNVTTLMRAFKNNVAGTNDFADIQVIYPASGSPYTYAPTPTEDTNNSNQIDTVGARNTKLANYVGLTGNQTIAGTKTFSSTISGSINGNAATVTNGVYTTGNQTIGGNKTFSGTATFSKTISGSISGNAATVTNGVYTTGNQTIAGNKTFSGTSTFSKTIDGSISGNAATVTNGVYTTGNQTIAGNKTFSGATKFTADPSVTRDFAGFNLNASNITKGTAPSADTLYSRYRLRDKDGTIMSSVYGIYRSNKSNQLGFEVMKANANADTAYSRLALVVEANGTDYGICPTPAVSSTGTTIATAGYINNKFKKVSTLPASPDANTFYFIPE